MKKLTIPEDQALVYTVEELQAIISVRKGRVAQEIIEMYFEVGKTIKENPLYTRYSKGAGEFVKELADQLSISTTLLYAAIKAYETYQTPENCINQLSTQLQRPYVNWSDIKKSLLPPPRHVVKCKRCQIHCKNND